MAKATWTMVPMLDENGLVTSTRVVRHVEPSELYGRSQVLEVKTTYETREDLDELERRAAALQERVKSGSLLMVCRWTDQHQWIWWAYTSPANVDLQSLAATEIFPAATVAIIDDPDGSLYREGFAPDEDDLRTAADAQVIATLVATGDPLTSPRPIDHYLQFRDPASAKVAKKRLKGAGVIVRDARSTIPSGQLKLEIASPAHHRDLRSVREYLRQLCPEAHYDGWESPVLTA